MLAGRTQNAIRAIVALARGGASKRGAGSLAKSSTVPRPYLFKLMAAMARRGLIDTKRGRGGGYRLLRDPASIRLADIAAIFDDGQDLPACMLVSRPCRSSRGCAAHAAMKPVIAAYGRFLERTTVADLIAEPCRGRRSPGPRLAIKGKPA
ncbi:MAG: Rrf2 family transcriptional regulator [Elusimicrobia bacterium]|nr:Rrf2 family transcriptional regulator [Elusimicrobiota bacterium]